MTASETANVGLPEPQSHQRHNAEHQTEPSQMIIDMDQPPGSIDFSRQTPDQFQDPPPYQPIDSDADGLSANIIDTGLVDDRWNITKGPEDEGPPEDYFVDDSSFEDARTKLKTWENSGIVNDQVGQSSDEYDDGLDGTADDDEDEADEEDELEDDLRDEDLEDVAFSDGDPEDMDGSPTTIYNQSMLHGPYLQSPRQDIQARKRHARVGGLRKRPQKFKAVGGAGTGRNFNQSVATPSAPPLDPSTETGTQPPGKVFMQTCRDVTRFLEHGKYIYLLTDFSRQIQGMIESRFTLHEYLTVPTFLSFTGSLQQALEMASELLEFAVQSRKSGEVSPDGMCSAEQLAILESSFFGTWAKLMIGKR
jgi:hypothetical protein